MRLPNGVRLKRCSHYRRNSSSVDQRPVTRRTAFFFFVVYIILAGQKRKIACVAKIVRISPPVITAPSPTPRRGRNRFRPCRAIVKPINAPISRKPRPCVVFVCTLARNPRVVDYALFFFLRQITIVALNLRYINRAKCVHRARGIIRDVINNYVTGRNRYTLTETINRIVKYTHTHIIEICRVVKTIFRFVRLRFWFATSQRKIRFGQFVY